jgi:threonine/homoserine/homoserine lactone efflux protein
MTGGRPCSPKLTLIFLSLPPQFIDYRAAGVFRQSLTLGGTLIIAFACRRHP